MIEVTLGKKNVYKLPTRHYELNLSKGVQVHSLVKDNMTEFDKKNLFSMLLDSPILQTERADPKMLDILYSKLEYFNGEYDLIYADIFKLGGTLYGVRKIGDLNLLEYIDLCVYMRDIEEHIEELASLLIRRVVKTKRKFMDYTLSILDRLLFRRTKGLFTSYRCQSYELEPYQDKIDTDLWDNMGYFQTKYIINNALDGINKIIKQFPVVYSATSISAEEYNREKHGTEVIKESNPLESYGLYTQLSDACDDDKIKIDYWLDKPYREYLSHVTFLIIKNRNMAR